MLSQKKKKNRSFMIDEGKDRTGTHVFQDRYELLLRLISKLQNLDKKQKINYCQRIIPIENMAKK